MFNSFPAGALSTFHFRTPWHMYMYLFFVTDMKPEIAITFYIGFLRQYINCTYCMHLNYVIKLTKVKDFTILYIGLKYFENSNHLLSSDVKLLHLTSSVSNFQRKSSNTKFSSLVLNGQCELVWSIYVGPVYFTECDNRIAPSPQK